MLHSNFIINFAMKNIDTFSAKIMNKTTKEQKRTFKERLQAIDTFIPVSYCTIIKHKHPHLSKSQIYRVRHNAVVNELIMAELEALAETEKKNQEMS